MTECCFDSKFWLLLSIKGKTLISVHNSEGDGERVGDVELLWSFCCSLKPLIHKCLQIPASSKVWTFVLSKIVWDSPPWNEMSGFFGPINPLPTIPPLSSNWPSAKSFGDLPQNCLHFCPFCPHLLCSRAVTAILLCLGPSLPPRKI